ncbi:hypothetical protein H2198_010241 [Neophaeococcomyces mojaviensis]|uniref:Uncharacterized protein n=1 Tax=Neophaeococcomyces mojaviensis TaxID=3383035 RepID=A0ACC2ZS90_9EURO|nr:hypothetical protein H2198_010241 [Knufia sp. JES_112]
MYLVDSLISLFTLQWTQSEPKLRPLPPHIKRTFVSTPGGDIELLICEPAHAADTATQKQPPVFFAHGGYGSAGVWLDWMTYLRNRNYSGTLYAYSVRNHGASYSLPYWRMVFQTPFEDPQSDMMACLDYVAQQQKQSSATSARPPILVGHSSGGGLSQVLLSGASLNPALRTKASGLCLVDAIPSYGSYDIYWNWLKQDPWFPLRSMLHLQHPTSPLSTDRLVHGAFFGHRFPLSATADFRQWMPAYETMGWPIGMVGNNFWQWARGGQNTWLSCRDIVPNISRAEEMRDGKDKVCVIVGTEDMMYRPVMWERQAKEYREALAQLSREEKGETAPATSAEKEADKPIPEVTVSSSGGVRVVLVEAAGHHVMNEVDELKYGAAEAFLRWANQV